MNAPLCYAKFYKIFQVTLQMQLTRPTLKRLVLLTLGVYGAKSFIILRGSKTASILKEFFRLKEDANKILCLSLWKPTGRYLRFLLKG